MMRPAMKRALWTIAAAVALAAGATGGCSPKIGDSCSQNVDCADDGTRMCDLSSPGGYCTIPGCEGGSCPDEAICVGFFPTAFLTRPCNPDTEDILCGSCNGTDCNASCDPGSDSRACENCDPASDPGCNARCEPGPATDDCAPDEVCLGIGLCARRQTERRYCMKKCSNNDDCRGGYVCRKTGTAGAELVPKSDEPYSHKERGFCSPAD